MLTNYNGTAITYDGIGNPLNWRNATSLTWQGRRLTAMVVNGTAMSFEYNSDGIRQSKTYGNTTVNYITDGSKIIAENRDGTYIYYVYDEKGAIMGMMYGGQMYTYRKNLQGDVTGIYTANGNLVVEYTYSPYGEVLSVTGTLASTIGTANPFRYRGYYYDTETEFYYLQSRYYDPVVGRFLNADVFVSTGQGILGNNTFAYCNNNPIIYADYSGFERVLVIYDDRSSGIFGFGGSGFRRQGELIAKQQRKKGNTVETMTFSSIEEFVKKWNSLDREYDTMIILSHGAAGSLDCNGQRLVLGSYVEKLYILYYISELKNVDVSNMVFLYSCNGGTADEKGNSMAQAFANITNAPVKACENGKVNINWKDAKVSNYLGEWEIFYSKTRPKKYSNCFVHWIRLTR